MKGIIKLTENLTFDVKYADGEVCKVQEGILFEVEESGTIVMHIGTDRPEVVVGVYEAAKEMVEDLSKMNGGTNE